MFRHLARWILASTLLASPVFAQTKVATPILLKVLTYDQGFDARGSGPFLIAVVSEPAQSSARAEVLAELRELAVTTIKNRPLRFEAIEFTSEKNLASEVSKLHPDALLAVPGLSSSGVSAVSAVGESNKSYTLAFDTAMVEQALMVGVSMATGRPQIVINDRAAKGVGAKFDAAVLKLARVVQ